MDQLATRTKYLKNIESTLASFNSKFEDLVKSLGWTVESLTKNTKEFDDPAIEDQQLETSHKDEETEKGYAAEPQDYEKMYNDLVANIPNQANKNSGKSQTQILAEALELERNTKRRRINYKNKVHTRNKSQTEVLRALVQEQMDVLKDIAGHSKEDDVQVKETNQLTETDSVGLIQVNSHGGNPHTVWKRIEQLLEEAQGTSGGSDRKMKSSSLRTSPSPEAKRKHRDDDKRCSRNERDKSKRHDDRRRSQNYDSHSDFRYIDSQTSQHDDRYTDNPTSKRKDRRDRDQSRVSKERHKDIRHKNDLNHDKADHHRSCQRLNPHSDDSRSHQHNDHHTHRTISKHDDSGGRRRQNNRQTVNSSNQNDDSSDHSRRGHHREKSKDKDDEYEARNQLGGPERSKVSEYKKLSRDQDRSCRSHRSAHRSYVESQDEKSYRSYYSMQEDNNQSRNKKKSSRSCSESEDSSDGDSEKSYSDKSLKTPKKKKKKKKKKEKRKKNRCRSRSSS